MKTQSLTEKAAVLSQIILLTRELYAHGQLNEAQKGLMETLIGAGIWYLPSSTKLYSGFISKKALEALREHPYETRLVEEHAFPRKVAGQFLYAPENQIHLTADGSGLAKLYKERFGRFNLVLKSENSDLKKFQKKGVFVDEQMAYAQAGIELVPFSAEAYQEYKSTLGKAKRKSSK